jgi:large subunit ribosomal protein L4
MELKVYTLDGAETKRTVTLDEAVFGVEPNDHAIWLDVKAIQANMRQGTHKVKERSENSHSTRKLYRQKGTGGARAGDAKSHLRKGGGTAFGPRPRSYAQDVNRKTKLVARRSALAYKAREEGGIRVLDALSFDAPSTKTMVQALGKHGVAGRRVLVLTEAISPNAYKSGRNIPGVEVMPATQASTLDLMQAHVIVLPEAALTALTEALKPGRTAPVAAPAVEEAPAKPARAKKEKITVADLIAPEPVEETAVETASVEAEAPQAEEAAAPVAETPVAQAEAPAADDAVETPRGGVSPDTPDAPQGEAAAEGDDETNQPQA